MKKILTILTIIVVLSLIGCTQTRVSDENVLSGEDLGLTSEEDIDAQDIEADIADIDNIEEDLSELESLEQDLENLI